MPAEVDFGSLLPNTTCSCALSYFGERIDIDSSLVTTLLKRIDALWMLQMQTCAAAELYDVVKDAASEVQGGALPSEAASRAERRFEEIRDWVSEGLKVRYEARSGVAFDGGLEAMEKRLAESCKDVLGQTKSVLQTLLSPERDVKKTRATAQRAVANFQEEYESIEVVKMANMDTLMVVDHDIAELHRRAWVFTEAALCVAGHATAPQKVVKTWLRTLQRLGKPGDPQDVAEKVCALKGADGVLRSMRLNMLDLDVQRDGCAALVLMAALAEQVRSEIRACDGIAIVKYTMELYRGETQLQTHGADILRLLCARSARPSTLPQAAELQEQTESAGFSSAKSARGDKDPLTPASTAPGRDESDGSDIEDDSDAESCCLDGPTRSPRDHRGVELVEHGQNQG